MTSKIIKTWLAGVIVFSLIGCAKKVQSGGDKQAAATEQKTEQPGPAGSDDIPGMVDVRTAMANKEYSAAVERLVALKALAVTSEQLSSYFTLFGEVRNQLSDAAPTNPGVAEALMTLRSARNGR